MMDLGEGFRRENARSEEMTSFSVQQPLQWRCTMLCFLLFMIKKIKRMINRRLIKKIISVKMRDELKYKACLNCHQNAYQS